ncbi:MAG TPA: Rieske 2Fe-2S domain-containing protein [Acidimicrobiia bacterium]|nr:Rieske 2Fe-2S domain-containing protein [Acidimicrobiia bacterium]
MTPGERDARNAARIVSGCFLLSAAGAIALIVVYWRGGQPQLEGTFLAVAFLSLGIGFVVWAHRLLPNTPRVEPRPPLGTTPEERAELIDDLDRGGVLERRRFLLGALTSALGAIGVSLLFPIRSLGPQPGNALDHTPWKKGMRVVTSDGEAVTAKSVPSDGLVTVFPEGFPDSADGQAVLMRVDPSLLEGARGGSEWAPDGLIAFSKVCTHAGCPVGLYQSSIHQLLCPCHQSAFDVLRGAEPTTGPADRALPQLPLMIDGDGVLRARGDFSSPVGPRTWNLS